MTVAESWSADTSTAGSGSATSGAGSTTSGPGSATSGADSTTGADSATSGADSATAGSGSATPGTGSTTGAGWATSGAGSTAGAGSTTSGAGWALISSIAGLRMPLTDPETTGMGCVTASGTEGRASKAAGSANRGARADGLRPSLAPDDRRGNTADWSCPAACCCPAARSCGAACSCSAATAACIRCSKASGSLCGVARGTGFARSRSVAPGTRRDSGGMRLSSPMRPNPLGPRAGVTRSRGQRSTRCTAIQPK
jgi:hypothetical protein